VPVDKELQPLARLDRLQKVGEIGGLRGIRGGCSLVVFGARVGGCTSSNRPLEVPVSVDVAADACASCIGLTVLAPKTLVGLSVNEAVGIDHGEDIEVVLVEETFDLRVRVVLGHEVICEVLVGHGRDPLARVDGAVEDDGGLDALAGAAPEVNACDGSSVEGISRRDNG
jgi:hypothetical protein